MTLLLQLLWLFSVCFGKLKKLEGSIRFPIDSSNVYQFILKIKMKGMLEQAKTSQFSKI